MFTKRLLTIASGFAFVLIASLAFMNKSDATNLLNSPPVAVTDYYTAHGAVDTNPTQNDYDPDGDGVIFDSIATQPQHGTLSYVGVGRYRYSAAAGYTGSDSFTYTIRDTYSNYSTGTVNISVVNQPPNR